MHVGVSICTEGLLMVATYAVRATWHRREGAAIMKFMVETGKRGGGG